MTGTSFILQPPTQHIADKAPLCFLTAQHTFAPWLHMEDGEKSDSIKIPPEYRKQRYVSGRIFLFDEVGSAMGGKSVSVNLSAASTEHDLALLTLPPAECDVFLKWIKERQIDRRFKLGPCDVGQTLSCTGFRGRGVLGDVSISKADEYKKWPQEKVAQMMKEMENIEGKQDAFAYGVTPETMTIGASTHGRGYAGMSGAPLLSNDNVCRGMLLGAGSNNEGVLLDKTKFVSGQTINDWCESLFQPLEDLLPDLEAEEGAPRIS